MANHYGRGHLRLITTPAESSPAEFLTGEPAGTEPAEKPPTENTGFFGVPKPPQANTFGETVSPEGQHVADDFLKHKGLFLPSSDGSGSVDHAPFTESDFEFMHRLTTSVNPVEETDATVYHFPRHLSPPDVH